MNPELEAGLLRLAAGLHRKRGAELELAASALMASQALKRLLDAMAAGDLRGMLEHPDLTHLDLQMNGFYEPLPPERLEP